jgi:hypothetical protein
MKLKKYRIVRDTYAGYEVQCFRLYFPFWIQCGINTSMSVEQAKEEIEIRKGYVVYTEN